MPDPTVTSFDLPRLRAGVSEIDAEAEGRKLDEQIRVFIATHTPTQEHFAKRITV